MPEVIVILQNSVCGQTYVCFFFCQKTVLPVFNVTHFDWFIANFQKCSDAQLIMGCFAFQQSLQAGIFLPFLHPLPLPLLSTLTPNQTWPVG